MDDRLDLRFQIHSGHRLRHPVRDSRHAKDSHPLATRLRNLHELHRRRENNSSGSAAR